MKDAIMLQRLLVLFAAAGLFVSAFAGQSADSTRVESRDRQHLRRDSVRMLRTGARDAALPSAIEANKVIQQVRQRRESGPPPELDANPFEGHTEFEVAPNAPKVDQYFASVAFDGTRYLVVWQNIDGDIYGALTTGTPPDPNEEAGFKIAAHAPQYNEPSLSVAFDGTDHYLVVWPDHGSGSVNNIYRALVTTEGGVTNLGAISAANNNQSLPSIAFDGTNYLVVWEDYRSGARSDLYGARVNKSGLVLDANGYLIASGPDETNQSDPSIAFDGTNFLVVWEDTRDGGADIYGARVSTEGSVWDPGGLHIAQGAGDNHQHAPSVAFDGTDFLVVWTDYRNYSDIYGARVKPNGIRPDEGGFLISDYNAKSWPEAPAVAFDGTDYLVAWADYGNWYIYGCPVVLPRTPGEVYTISAPENDYPAIAAAPVEGTVMAAYQSGEYGETRIWARAADLPLTGDVGTDSIERPVASFIEAGSWKIPPAARLKNFGSEPRSFLAKFTITPGTWSSTKTVLGLRPGDAYRRTVAFDPFDLDAAGAGLYKAKCTTMLADELTTDRGNDWKTAIFQGCTFINFSDRTTGDLVADPPTEHWIQDGPEAPWKPAPMDAIAWGYRADGFYDPSEATTLTSPEYTAGQANPMIAFQHCFDTEAGEDGGNFSYSTGGYTNWDTLLATAGLGYPGSVSALIARGWSGSALDWQQSVFTIPVTSGKFKVRWRFAAGNGNTTHHGWLIDEVAGIGCELYVPTPPSSGPGSVIDTLGVYPNPVSGPGQISYTLWKDCNVTINLYDASGRLAQRVPTSGFKKGPNTAALDASRLSRGVYFVKVKGESDTKTTKVIIE
jgi:hypothetical protein